MNKTSVDCLKNIFLAVFFAYLISRLPVWVNPRGVAVISLGAGLFLWVWLTAYDEILKKKKKSRRHMFLQNHILSDF